MPKRVKPYGRSEVNPAGNDRRLNIDARARDTTAARQSTNDVVDIFEYLSNNERFFLAQWTSILDKLLWKPKTRTKLTLPVWQARQDAGDAFLRYWTDDTNGFELTTETMDYLSKNWPKRVHPYGAQEPRSRNNDKPARPGRWFRAITGCDNVDSCNWDEVAEAVYQHLYVKQKKLDGKKQYQRGLIELASRAISNNSRRYSAANGEFSAGSRNEQRRIIRLRQDGFFRDWQAEKKDHQLDELINDLAHALEEKIARKKEQLRQQGETSGWENEKLTTQEAAALLHQHYNRVFGSTRVTDLEKQEPDRWAYHCMIREALRAQYPKNRKKSARQPLSASRLHHLAVSIEHNRLVALAIRIGKVLHYQRDSSQPTLPDAETVANSDCWSTKGQTRMKQNEAFVRHWLRAIALANVTLERLVDPDGKTGNDVLLQAPFQQVRQDLDQHAPDFDAQFQLLFGPEHGLYIDDAQRDKLLYNLQAHLAGLRHAVFHFKDIGSFNAAINRAPDGKGKILTAVENNIQNYIQRHIGQQRQRYIEQLRSADAQAWLREKDLRKVLFRVLNGGRSLLPLPRFNRLLTRAENKKTWNGMVKFMPPANRLRMDKPTGYRTAYICLKLLYERHFGAWLEEQGNNDLREWVNQAKENATGEAQAIFQNEPDIKARVERLRGLSENETLSDYFSYLTGEIASEDMVQQNNNIYASSGNSAKAVANYVENLKLDLLILALGEYLKQSKLTRLGQGRLNKNTSHPPDLDAIASNIATQTSDIAHPWLYLVLHLMPVEAVSSLALQMIKHRVLTGRDDYREIHRTLTLYMDMHDELVSDTQTLQNDDGLCQFYDDPNQYDNMFANDDNTGLIPVRGLREILRYGNIRPLQILFDGFTVSPADVEKLHNYTDITRGDSESPIARLQERREKLHKLLARDRRPASQRLKGRRTKQQLLEEYRKCNEGIVHYRELRNTVYLHNVKLAHQLMMASLARLLGFSQLWERDAYFVLLALVFLRQADDADTWQDMCKALAKGQIIRALDVGEQTSDKILQAIVKEVQTLFCARRSDENRQTRNDLAHLNPLRNRNGVKLTPLVNRVRQMMAYDRKLKNAVSKAIIQLFKRENLKLRFAIESANSAHALKFDTLRAETICHLEDSIRKAASAFGDETKKRTFLSSHRIEEALHSEKFTQIISNLM